MIQFILKNVSWNYTSLKSSFWIFCFYITIIMTIEGIKLFKERWNYVFKMPESSYYHKTLQLKSNYQQICKVPHIKWWHRMFVLAPSTEEISSPQRYFLGWIRWEQHLGLKRTLRDERVGPKPTAPRRTSLFTEAADPNGLSTTFVFLFTIWTLKPF